jgi:hypothetical protein
MLPYDLATQEFRVHYAGFFDPGFGYGEHGEIPGTKAVLEVRASQMPILLEDDQFVGRLNYFNMSATPDKVYGGLIGSSYQQQGLALSKQFKRASQYMSATSRDSLTQRYTAHVQNVETREKFEVEEEDDSISKSTLFPSSHEQPIHAKKAD